MKKIVKKWVPMKWKNALRRSFYWYGMFPKRKKTIINQFHALYYDDGLRFGRNTWRNTFWFGVPLKKCPTDLWIYQELLYKIRPDVIVECGTAYGGSAYYLACLLDLLGKGRVISIDIRECDKRPQHDRITYLLGSSTSEAILTEVKEAVKGVPTVMVILDSDHSKAHVLEELRKYHLLVTMGSYLIVEDTNVYGHPVALEFGPGPMEALDIFLKENKNFVRDEGAEKFYMTFNPKGYLKRVL